MPTFSLVDDATASLHRFYQNLTYVANDPYIVSFHAKAGTSPYAQIYISGVSNNYANFDLSAGTVSAGTGGAGAIQSIGNGWYRCSLSFTATAGGSNAVNIVCINSGTAARALSYTGTGTGFYLTGVQAERTIGQSIQSMGEYVSTNVLSFPYQ